MVVEKKVVLVLECRKARKLGKKVETFVRRKRETKEKGGNTKKGKQKVKVRNQVTQRQVVMRFYRKVWTSHHYQNGT